MLVHRGPTRPQVRDPMVAFGHHEIPGFDETRADHQLVAGYPLLPKPQAQAVRTEGPVEGCRHIAIPAEPPVRLLGDRGEGSFHRLPGSRAHELVRVDGEDKVRPCPSEGLAGDTGDLAALEEGLFPAFQQDERQPLRFQAPQDATGGIARAMVQNHQPIQEGQVVPNEGLDDVGLVAHHRDCPQLHWSSWKGAGTPNRTGDLPLTRRLLYQLSYAGRGWAF